MPYREQACEEMVYKYIFSSEVRVCTLEGGKFLMEVSLSSQLYLPQTVCKEKRSEREREREEVVQEKKWSKGERWGAKNSHRSK